MYRIIKRDGKIADFNISKISEALRKAFVATGTPITPAEIDFLALRVTADFEPKVNNGFISVETVQDSAESVLSSSGYAEVAKAYILYRKQHEKARALKSTILDYKETVNDYVNAKGWRNRDNSTVSYSVGGLILNNSSAITANYWLSEIYDQEISTAHKNGDLHLHELSMLTGYCAGWSLRQLIHEGLGGVSGKISSKPPKHLYSLCNQMVNFLGVMQNEWAGAQSFCSFDTCLAPFIKVDNLPYTQVKNCIETFVFGVNTPSRWGTQAPFSNIGLDWTVPGDMADERPVIGGKEVDFTYGDCQPEMDMVNRAFLEVMLSGDEGGSGLLYPIPTYRIGADFDDSDTENNRLLFEMAAKYGMPYFANYRNALKEGDVRSVRRQEGVLVKKGGGFFGSGENTGSVGAVTLNLPRIAYLSETESEFYRRLGKLMDLTARSLSVKRTVVNKLMAEGMYPYSRRYIKDFSNCSSTIGVLGMNEACLNARWIRRDLTDPSALAFALDVIHFMRARLLSYQAQQDAMFNLEATPAESTATRFAIKDRELYPDIITAAHGGTPFYTNSTQLPVEMDDFSEALRVQSMLQPLYTGGTVFHIFLDRRLPDWRAAMDVVKLVAQTEIPYFTLTPTYSVCPQHGYIDGESRVCGKCGKETQVMSRITGYYRPVQCWNIGKQQEYRQRRPFRL